MKNFLKIILLLFIITFSATNITHAAEDIDGDKIIDELDTQNTYYNVINTDLHKYFLYDFSKNISTTSDNTLITNIVSINKDNKIVYLDNGDRKYIGFNEIGSSRVDAFKNKQDYFYINSDENKILINEKEIIKYVCNQADITENRYSCESLGHFSEIKFKATSGLDTDNDGVNDFDSSGDKLDLEDTNSENIRFICTPKDIQYQNDKYQDGTSVTETIGYDCNNSQLGKFSEIKKGYFIDTDKDGIVDYLDTDNNTKSSNAKYICNPKDIENHNDSYPNGDPIIETVGYGCDNSQLGSFSQTKFDNFNDADNDGVLDYLDNDINTSSQTRKFICSQDDIDDNLYNCDNSQLGSFSQVKLNNFTDSDGDGVSDALDSDNSTNYKDLQFVCTSDNIKNNQYGCISNQLGSFSQTKFDNFNDSDNDGISDALDSDNSTSSDNSNFICTENNIENNLYGCTSTQLGSFSQTKFDNFNDSDNDGISDALDSDDSTSSDNSKFVCNNFDIEAGRYGCTSGSLGKLSQSKKEDSINLNSVSSNDNELFGLEVGQSQSQDDLNLQTGADKDNGIADNEKLDNLNGNSDINVSQTGAIGIKNTLIRIAKDLKNLFFFVASIYLLILVLKLLISDKTEEASNNLKKGGLWISIGLIVTQVAYAFVMVLFDKGVSENLAEEFAQQIFTPFIGLLETAASFFFIIIAFYAFFKLVTAHGNEESVKSGKMSIIYAIMGFIIIKITKTLVNSIYGKVNCSESSLTSILKASTSSGPQCLGSADLEGFAKLVVDVINWANGFIGIILVVLIIYTGAKILLSAGNEDTLKSSKSSFLYIAIGVGLLVMNYLILTFFLLPEVPIS